MLIRSRTTHFRSVTLVTILFGVFAPATVSVSSGQDAQKPALATVVDTNGKSYSVTALEAKYTPGSGGFFPFGTPTSWAANLYLRLYFVEDRVTSTEQQEFQFASISRLVFERLESGNIVRVEFRDGSRIVLTSNLLERIDVAGGKRATQLNRWLFETESGRSIDGFRGQSKTPSGKEGEFWINISEIRSIEFR